MVPGNGYIASDSTSLRIAHQAQLIAEAGVNDKRLRAGSLHSWSNPLLAHA